MLLVGSFILCQGALSRPAGRWLAHELHQRLPVPYIGAAIGSLLLSPAAILVVNWLVPSDVAAHWAYHKRSYGPFGNALYSAAQHARPRAPVPWAMLLLFRFRARRWMLFRWRRRLVAMAPPRPQRIRAVMLTLADDKVYVGLVRMGPPKLARDFDEIVIVPLWSGYRNAERRVIRTTDYRQALTRWVVDDGRSMDGFEKVIRTRDIVSIGFYDDGVFDQFSQS